MTSFRVTHYDFSNVIVWHYSPPHSFNSCRYSSTHLGFCFFFLEPFVVVVPSSKSPLNTSSNASSVVAIPCLNHVSNTFSRYDTCGRMPSLYFNICISKTLMIPTSTCFLD